VAREPSSANTKRVGLHGVVALYSTKVFVTRVPIVVP